MNSESGSVGSENTAPSNECGKDFEWASRLFEEHESFIRSVIRFAIQEPSEWDDYFQELYLYFSFNRPSEEIRKPQGYLYRVIVDRGKDWNRRHYRRQQKQQQLFDLARRQQPSEEADADFLRREEINDLFKQIETYLSENEARAILFRYKYNYTIDETAREMGLRRNTVIRYVCVGFKKIRKILKDTERAE